MSISLMSVIWEHGPDRQADRFVLLALADFAGDDGECWPSLEAVARKTCMSVRGVRQIIRRLEAEGWLHVDVGGGRSATSMYKINRERCSAFYGGNTERGSGYGDENPERHSRNDDSNPEHDAVFSSETRNVDAQNPERGSPEPLRTTKVVVVGDARARDQLAVDRSNVVPHPAAASASSVTSADQLYDRVLAAAGLTSGRMPTWWLPPAATLHVARWRQLGLTDDEIVEVVRQMQARFTAPPSGPKAYDRAIAAYAAEKNQQIETPQPAAQQTTRTGGKSQKDYFDGYLERLKKRLGVDDEEFEKYLRLQ